jgi:Integrase core domain
MQLCFTARFTLCRYLPILRCLRPEVLPKVPRNILGLIVCHPRSQIRMFRARRLGKIQTPHLQPDQEAPVSSKEVSMNETLFFGIDHACEAVARWTNTYNTERPHSALGYQAPAVFAAQLTAMGDQLRAPETLRRSPIAPSAQPRQVQQRTLVSAGLASGVTATGIYPLPQKLTVSGYRSFAKAQAGPKWRSKATQRVGGCL